jgi:hypothetical protein
MEAKERRHLGLDRVDIYSMEAEDYRQIGLEWFDLYNIQCLLGRLVYLNNHGTISREDYRRLEYLVRLVRNRVDFLYDHEVVRLGVRSKNHGKYLRKVGRDPLPVKGYEGKRTCYETEAVWATIGKRSIIKQIKSELDKIQSESEGLKNAKKAD